jgi:hypothetical protein
VSTACTGTFSSRSRACRCSAWPHRPWCPAWPGSAGSVAPSLSVRGLSHLRVSLCVVLIHTHMHARVHTHTCTHAYIRTHASVCVHTHARAHTYTHTHTLSLFLPLSCRVPAGAVVDAAGGLPPRWCARQSDQRQQRRVVQRTRYAGTANGTPRFLSLSISVYTCVCAKVVLTHRAFVCMGGPRWS